MKRSRIGLPVAGFCAGAVNALFGGGGGMVLVPLLTAMTDLEDNEIFPSSIAVILPVCLVSLIFAASYTPLPWRDAAPYLAGSAIGGTMAGLWGRKIPVLWLHRGLGILILWGGVRYLC